MARSPGQPGILTAVASGVELRVKVVPGARQARVAGRLGDRLKLAVSAPPEDGKANAAVCALVAGLLGVGPRQVRVVAGPTRPQKTLAVEGVSLERALDLLGPYLA